MTDDFNELRWVLLEGPPLLFKTVQGMKRGEPLWSFVAGAPYSGDGDLASHVHPLRTLMVDGLIPGVDKQSPKVAVDPNLKNDGEFKSGAKSPHDFRAPRLLDVHIIAGATKTPYGPNNPYNEEVLSVQLSEDSRATTANPKEIRQPRTFWTRRLGTESASFPKPDATADFIHVVVEPQPEPQRTQEGDFADQAGNEVEKDKNSKKWIETRRSNHIRIPPLRLVQGAIPIVLKKGGLTFLKELISGDEVILTPDGIEFVATVRLPGSADLKGGFLLAPCLGSETDIAAPSGMSRAALSLTLLPNHPETVKNAVAWLDAWKNAVGFENTADEPLGVEFRTRLPPAPPALRWPLFLKKGVLFSPGIKGEGGLAVDSPVEEMRVELRGSIASDGTPDGAATVRMTRLRLADSIGATAIAKALKSGNVAPDETLPGKGDLYVVAEAFSPAPSDLFTWARTSLSYPKGAAQTGKLQITRDGGLLLGHDERQLARDLRTAVGWPEPRRLPKPQEDKAGSERFAEGERPLLSGFVPLAEGWLQIPVPNLPAADLTSDAALVSLSETGRRSVIDGFVRYGDRAMSGVLSGFSSARSSPIGATPPWSVMLISADSAVVIARIETGAAPRVAECSAILRNPDLTLRGLVLLSADRPDALEALPRLGAGAGSFIDLKLRNYPKPDSGLRIVSTTVSGFAASFDSTRNASRDAVDVTLAFNRDAPAWTSGPVSTAEGAKALAKAISVLIGEGTKRATKEKADHGPAPWPSVAWVRDGKTPLAASMPMTRSASSAVRPLESRSYAPYVGKVPAPEDSSTVIATIRWDATGAFPQRGTVPAFTKLAAAWPLPAAPKKLVSEDKTVPMSFGGIPFVAFGVPGVEVSPLAPGKTPWQGLHFAVRYDIPALDEAFAATALPPTDPPVQSDEMEGAPERPVATALDWPLMGQLWHEQDRCRQNSLVVDSYLALQAAPADGSYYQVESTSLVRAAIWKPQLSFALADTGVPYGLLGLQKPAVEMTGDAALLGLSLDKDPITLRFAGEDLKLTRMVGWSPAGFDWDGFEVDNQGYGLKAPIDGKTLFVRPVHNYSGDGRTGSRFLATAKSEFPIENVELLNASKLAFWFRDIPLDETGNFEDLTTDTNFSAWLDPTGGGEWRLFEIPVHASGHGKKEVLPASFENGRDRIPFFGFMLEPIKLRKLAVSLAEGEKASPENVEVLARLTLSDDETLPPTGNDLVVLRFGGSSGTLRLEGLDPFDPEGMVFSFPAVSPTDPRGVRKTICLAATPGWSGNELTVSPHTLRLPLYGWQASLANPTIDAKNGSVTISAKGGPVPAEATGSYVAIKSAVITISTADGKFKGLAELSLTSRAQILPDEAAFAPVSVETASDGSATFNFLDLPKVPARHLEDYHALTIVGANRNQAGKAALLSVLNLGNKRTVAFMLAARVDQPMKTAPHVLPLTCGRCEGEVRIIASGSGAPFNVSVVRWELTKASTAAATWTGFAEVSGAFASDSTIAWPKVATEDAGDGRAVIKIAFADSSYRHNAEYIFLKHRLAFGLCGPTKTGWRLIKPWRICVASSHKLTDGGATILAWQGVESIAIGPADQIAPRLPKSKSEIEAVTFAARYRGTSGSTMIQSGLGELRTVLQGTLGKAFREGFWTPTATGGADDWPGASADWTLVAGGFIGLQSPDGTQGGDEHVLLRLPFLSAFGTDALKPGQLSQDGIPVDGVIVSWPDSSAARKLLLRDRGMLAPTSPAEADLTAAVRSGSLVTSEGQPLEGDVMPALLVEQSFRSTEPSGDWRRQPHWLASAAILSTLVNEWKSSGRAPDAFRPFSIVAASTAYKRDNKPPLRRGLAAAIRAVEASVATIPSTPPPALISAGRDLAIEPWTASNPGEEALNGQMVGRALARHANPVFALARLVEGVALAYRTAILPIPASAELQAGPRGKRDQAVFADLARGHATGPGTDPMRWLTPVGEGRTGPIRDYDAASQGSGVAGLGRQLGLPAHAGPERQLGGAAQSFHTLARDLIWFSERRVPVYEPLPISGMLSPPIPWLRQSPTRARLPADEAVGVALAASGLGTTPRTLAQSFLPAVADALSVGERAGVITARRALLLGTLTGTEAFDRENPGFGRPAQSGSSARLWMRTPRPGPLPANTGDPERDRRPEASPLLPGAPLRFLVGPADTIRGETKYWRPDANEIAQLTQWSATFVAAPFSDGILSDRWDGSVRLRIEVDVLYQGGQTGTEAKVAPKPAPPLKLLQRLMFPIAVGKPDTLLACGSLQAGTLTVALRRMIGLETEARWIATTPSGVPWVGVDPSAPEVGPGESIIWRSHVDVVLDVSPSGSGGPTHSALSAAIATGVNNVELRLLVHPASNAHDPIDLTKEPILSGETGSALASGSDRPPVTLRWQMPAVARQRANLPLAPSTLLFVDPAYEAALAHPPVEQARMIDISGVSDLPVNRGALRAVLSADRARVNRRSTIAFMADVRFERPAPAHAYPAPNGSDGDLADVKGVAALTMSLRLMPRNRTAPQRDLVVPPVSLPPKPPQVQFAETYEVSLAALQETDGSPARLAAGDVLVLTLNSPRSSDIETRFWNSELNLASGKVKISKAGSLSLSLRFTLTDEPVVEPPQALYAALARSQTSTTLPLYAQSPLPSRVDFRDLKADFRSGLVRRSASFVWTLSRPCAEYGVETEKKAATISAHVVKIDRNGQMHLPDSDQEFLPPDRMS
ncbi:hypothetical protein G6M78_20680 [Agrobacterium tumefaciens]|uniref:hypothetical protein n=1 Tax=Agrobacterium tumefaciens TaxID=358 RepID=UPI0015719C56|nr:hypothetical protein [Agrobacterium tumefaciens]NTE57481.1 hypothetical protein [Agrobacterium tumefaciens]NTE69975.1 hypothetical protein [Agrobacterium tumefaciens]